MNAGCGRRMKLMALYVPTNSTLCFFNVLFVYIGFELAKDCAFFYVKNFEVEMRTQISNMKKELYLSNGCVQDL